MAAFSSASHGIDLLPPERKRPARPASVQRRMGDVVDAEFEVVPLARAHHGRAACDAGDPRNAPDVGPFLRQFERRLHQISPRVFAGLTLVLCAAAFLAAALLAPAAPPAVPTLGFRTVKTDVQDADGLKVVAIYGTVVNPTGVVRDIPPIRIDVATSGRHMSADGQLAGSRTLSPGESRAFSARVPHSGGSAPIVQISFVAPGASSR